MGSHREELAGPSRGTALSRSRRSRRGLFLTVVGPDGAGKTSFCDALVAGALRGRDVRRVHHRFGLPPVRGGATSDPTQPHAQAPYSRVLSEAKALYLFADSLSGWLFTVRPFVRRGGCLILERGWWDLAVDPARYRLDARNRLVGVLGHMLPRPDLLIVLEAPAAILAARKDEVPQAELARQVRAWRAVVPDRQRRVYLDASLPLDEVVSRAAVELVGLNPDANRRSM